MNAMNVSELMAYWIAIDKAAMEGRSWVSTVYLSNDQSWSPDLDSGTVDAHDDPLDQCVRVLPPGLGLPQAPSDGAGEQDVDSDDTRELARHVRDHHENDRSRHIRKCTCMA